MSTKRSTSRLVTQIIERSRLGLVEDLFNIQQRLNLADFQDIFGPAMGNHLWPKFSADHNLLTFLHLIDSKYVDQFFQWVDRREL
jgi:hypothetical protein